MVMFFSTQKYFNASAQFCSTKTCFSCNSYQKTTSLIGGVTANITTKLGQMRHSESFRSIEEKVGSAYENVKVFTTFFPTINCLTIFFVCENIRPRSCLVLTHSRVWMKRCDLVPALQRQVPPFQRINQWRRGWMGLFPSLCVCVLSGQQCLHCLHYMNYAITNRFQFRFSSVLGLFILNK